MSEKEKIKKTYEGHRKRLRQRFTESGFRGFQDYEVLEILLQFVISRKDTKQIAKNLLTKFKTFQGVLSADINNLQEIKGIKERTAQYIKIIFGIIKYYFEQKTKSGEFQFATLNELVDYFRATIGGKKNEVMHIIYLNSQNKLIGSGTLSEGTVSETVAFPRKIVEGALKHYATTVIIAHNHPGGLAEPSDKDNIMTKQIKDALQTVNIMLQEHIIISDDGFYSYRKNGILD